MIEFDYTNVRQEVIGFEHGLDVDFEFKNYSIEITEIIKRICRQSENPDFANSWRNFLQYKNKISEILDYADMVRGKFENIIVIGPAGSLSGIKAVSQAILMPYWNSLSDKIRSNYPRLDLISNIDPDEINGLASVRNFKKSLIITISQYGMNPEVMSVFMIAKRRMEYELGENYRMHMVACTSPNSSLFYQLAKQEGYKIFEFSENMPGRFSLFSPCGMLPLALLGINIEELLAGAIEAFVNMENTDIYNNEAAKIALLHYLLYTQKNKNCSVIMPYSSRLSALPEWCSQIKSDILSRTLDKDGNVINIGQIPYSAIGCSDQHTLLQMFNQGPNNKLINIFKVENFDTDNVIPQFYDYTAVGYLGGKTLTELMNAEINAAKMTLVDNQRPNITMNIPKISPFYIGQFMALYMGSMLIQACLYNIDPFVRLDSDMLLNYIYAQLGKYGYEATYHEMQCKLNRYKVMS